MARLIDADKIVNGIALYMAENAYLNDTPLDALKMVANWITEAPPVDAVEVVRCRDCKHWNVHPINGRCILGKCLKLSRVMGDSSFCSYGERKDDGSDG